jgi:hypothetical protein
MLSRDARVFIIIREFLRANAPGHDVCGDRQVAAELGQVRAGEGRTLLSIGFCGGVWISSRMGALNSGSRINTSYGMRAIWLICKGTDKT